MNTWWVLQVTGWTKENPGDTQRWKLEISHLNSLTYLTLMVLNIKEPQTLQMKLLSLGFWPTWEEEVCSLRFTRHLEAPGKRSIYWQDNFVVVFTVQMGRQWILFKKSKCQFNTVYFWLNFILATAQNFLKTSYVSGTILGIRNIIVNKALSLTSRNLHRLNNFIIYICVEITRAFSSNQGLRLNFVKEILAEMSLKGYRDKCIHFLMVMVL